MRTAKDLDSIKQMKICWRVVIVLTSVYQSLAFITTKQFSSKGWKLLSSFDGNDQLDALQRRLQAKLLKNQIEVKLDLTDKAIPSKDLRNVVKQSVNQEKTTVNQIRQEKSYKNDQIKTSTRTNEQSQNAQVISIEDKTINSVEIAEGVGLGLLPYLLIPALLLNAARSFINIQKSKPRVATSPSTETRSKVYTKSITEGAKEGYFELYSGKKSRDLDDIRNGYKIVAASLGAAAVFTLALIVINKSSSEVSISPKLETVLVQENKKENTQNKVFSPVQTQSIASGKSESKPISEKAVLTPPADQQEKQNKDTLQLLERTQIKAEEVKETPKIEPKSEEMAKPPLKLEAKEDKAILSASEDRLEQPNSPIASEVKLDRIETQQLAKDAKQETKAIQTKSSATANGQSSIKIQVITVEGTNTNIKKPEIKQIQPDVVDLAKFQSLRNKKN